MATKISKLYVEGRLHEIEKEKLEAWKKANPEPPQPTDKEVEKALRAGDFKVVNPCKCTPKGWRGGGFESLIGSMVKVAVVEKFRTEDEQWRKRKEEIEDRVRAKRRTYFEAIMFSKADFLKSVEAFKSWNP